MEHKPLPTPTNYPDIKRTDTDRMIRERCLLYVIGNDSTPSSFCIQTGTGAKIGTEAYISEAQRLFEYIKTGR